MLLSEFIGKPVRTEKKICGICRGLGVSLKSLAVKFLICSGEGENRYEIFYIPISAVNSFSEAEILLSRRRVIAAASTNKFFCGKPIYSQSGAYLGIAADLEFTSSYIIAFISDTGASFPAFFASAIGDAILLKKTPNFPIGREIKNRLSWKNEKISPFVNKTLLKSAVEKGKLISLTTSLSPFISH